MQPPKPQPLRSRLIAFAIATCLVVVLSACLQPSNFAYAAEIPVSPEAVQHIEFEASIPPAPPDDPPIETRDGPEEEESGDALYAPLFAYFDESLVGRQEDILLELNNNQAKAIDIAPGQTKRFRFKKSQLGHRSILYEVPDAHGQDDTTNASADSVQLVQRQAQSRLWISTNTCRQPILTAPILTDAVSQLTLWVWTSKSSSAARPGSVVNSTFEGGHAQYAISTNEDVYVEISAPKLTPGWDGSWRFEIAASVDEGYYHTYDNSTAFAYMVDTDSDSTLFITHNMTDFNNTEQVNKWIEEHKGDDMPFDIYAFPDTSWSPMMGLERSYCGLREQFEQSNNLSVTTSITTQFQGPGLPKGMFNVQGLKTSTKYTGFLVLNGTSNMTIDGTTTRGGGRVFQSFQWETKADDTCQVIFGLEECSAVAYAVPSSPLWKNNDTGLIAFYDGLAKTYMENFRRSLAQIACDTTGTAQYSLARTCADCEADYKAWMCSVLIPRCEDWTANATWLHPRNIATPFANGSLPLAENATAPSFNATMRNAFAYNQSRNPAIDEVVKPGPYKELLPCEDLCFDIVRSCPARLGFACPEPPMRALSYGQRGEGSQLRCNFPGAVTELTADKGAAAGVAARAGLVLLVAGLAVAYSSL